MVAVAPRDGINRDDSYWLPGTAPPSRPPVLSKLELVAYAEESVSISSTTRPNSTTKDGHTVFTPASLTVEPPIIADLAALPMAARGSGVGTVTAPLVWCGSADGQTPCDAKGKVCAGLVWKEQILLLKQAGVSGGFEPAGCATGRVTACTATLLLSARAKRHGCLLRRCVS